MLRHETPVLPLEVRAKIPKSCPVEAPVPFVYPTDLVIFDQCGGPVHPFECLDRKWVRVTPVAIVRSKYPAHSRLPVKEKANRAPNKTRGLKFLALCPLSVYWCISSLQNIVSVIETPG